MSEPRSVVVWGNCQAAPLAALLTGPLAELGLTVVPVPPVFLTTPAGLDQVRALVGDSALLLSQPVSDEYAVAGCGTDQLAAYLPAGGRLIRLPSAFDAAAYPFQVLAHDSAGRIAAPLTNYHDLRIIAAAATGRSVEETLGEWLSTDPARLAAHAELSWLALTERENPCDVRVSPVIRQDAAMFAINHPANTTLTYVADQVLALLGSSGRATVPEREFLGSTRTPVEAPVAGVLGWRASEPDHWVVDGTVLSWEQVVTAHLDFYRDHPDVVGDTAARFAERLEVLGLTWVPGDGHGHTIGDRVATACDATPVSVDPGALTN